MNKLLDIGFKRAGRWRLVGGELRLQLDHMQTVCPALYAFVVGREVKYVGKTIRTVRQRLQGYLKPGPTQRTNERVRRRVLLALNDGQEVQILIFEDTDKLRRGQFRINLAAGLEDDIIAQLSPIWNGERQSSPEFNATSDACEEENRRIGENARPIDFEGAVPRDDISSQVQFEVVIGKTYYAQGFFNVPVRWETCFGPHDSELRIACSGLAAPVIGRISRKANQSEAPRILGGARLRNWFWGHLHQDDAVRVEVDTPSYIRMTKA